VIDRTRQVRSRAMSFSGRAGPYRQNAISL
jgi:hypothetical protein